ncbi:SGNH/GDSL hydrolase family protein [Hymenobacter sp. BT186]|uniref:SGNH/GDSL hydrolase family protein n=1 Tax=Hymenobacter telluris TaxID=2816474 RepID=A0A939EW11_9BACT|nr:SGNH/GDSL hydrolase family protein [Hymenobacter telluris]MBO0358071.1 SGNH/GDSL hydrolase family protein [Hymenobacter telluris]MBW3374098.1 SGNH/GDSL hydrolase family protein [Hymenobacter norwichensis]
MHITIVGGCFPVQYNIEPDQLYHHTLRKLLATHCADQWPALEIIRYERFSTCLAKLAAAQARQPTQVVLFHLRAEPVMRLSKLYYRFLNDQNQVRHSLNFSWGPHSNPERYDLLTRLRPAPALPPPPETRLHRYFRQLNLRLGAAVGNRRRALRQYQELVAAVVAFCQHEGIRLLLVGPVSRPCAQVENRLSWQLDAHFTRFAQQHGLDYLPTLGETDATGQPLFFSNGIHVSPAGHHRIGHLLYQRLQPASAPPCQNS